MDFTKAQKSAIDERDCSLIISAGAGSGKTAVLTERILSRICDENDDCNIDDFLIVTFTNAAAKELGDRIRKKLSERASSDVNNTKILNNIALLPLAKISTINAFCYEIVRDNFQKIGLSASVRIADESEMQVIRTRIMNEVLDETFEICGDDEGFLAAYEIFSSAKNDAGFVETLLELDNKLNMLPDPAAFCRKVLEEYAEISDCTEFFDTTMGKKLRANTLYRAEKTEKTMTALMGLCSNYEDLKSSYLPAIDMDRDFARAIRSSCAVGYEEVRKTASEGERLSLKAIRGAIKPAIKDLVKDCRTSANKAFRDELEDKFSCSHEQLALAAKDTYKILSALFSVVKNFSDRVSERKKELGIIEFADAERYALKLLVESVEPFEVTDLANAMRRKYKEIYIDEYQDVNPLQDLIFKSISRHSDDGVEYSRFMVGDIKQSIYRFRGASSDIFMGYRNEFGDIDEGSLRKRIFMSDNFRCSQSVIGLTNILFERLMKEYFAVGDALNFARMEEQKIERKALLSVFSYEKDEAKDYSATELEGILICDKIKNIVNNAEYTDSKGDRYSYSDICVLARSKNALRTYEAVFTSLGVPVESDVGERFYEKKEIVLCLDILNAIDNPERDIYLAGFMRSFAGEFSDDELALIKKKYKKYSLYRSVINYSRDENADANLRNKCAKFAEKLNCYRAFSRGKSADKLIWKIYCDFDLLNKSSSFGSDMGKKSVRKNLLKLYNIARDFSSTSFRGVGEFIDYVNGAMQNNDDKSEREIGQDAVRLMTIHASKGLEFPVCFVSNLSKRHNKKDEQKRLVFSEKAGLATTLCDARGMESIDSDTGLISINTPFRRFVGSEIDKELIDEEIRILYVAMTRARDVLIMTSPLNKKLGNLLKDARSLKISDDCESSPSYLMLLMSCLADDSALAPLYMSAELDFEPESDKAASFLECEHFTTTELLDKLCCFDRENSELESKEAAQMSNRYLAEKVQLLKDHASKTVKHSQLPAKITVSRLKTGLLDEEHLADTVKRENAEDREKIMPTFLAGEQQKTGAEKGTAMHMFMQFADFDACGKGNVEKEADRLYEDGFIDGEQRKLLDIQRLKDFFASDFCGKIQKSGRVYREQRFNLIAKSLEQSLEEEILVQGVIDLFFENEDGSYTVVDFKTDRVFGSNAESVLIDRHRTQLLYYKRAVEEMTGKMVKNAVIYSFALMKEIVVE